MRLLQPPDLLALPALVACRWPSRPGDSLPFISAVCFPLPGFLDGGGRPGHGRELQAATLPAGGKDGRQGRASRRGNQDALRSGQSGRTSNNHPFASNPARVAVDFHAILVASLVVMFFRTWLTRLMPSCESLARVTK